jgi:methylmalonyl-CoA mutase C-terminal domain/subunit
LTKSFIDSHDRAIKTIAVALRDASMEVVLLDYEVPADIVSAAIDEDVDVIGVSFMSGGQVEVTRELMALISDSALDAIPVVVGGTIRPFDMQDLLTVGVRRIYRGGERLNTITSEFLTFARESRRVRMRA